MAVFCKYPWQRRSKFEFCANSNSQNKGCSEISLDLEEFLIDFDRDRDILDEVTVATTHTPDAKDIRVPTPG